MLISLSSVNVFAQDSGDAEDGSGDVDQTQEEQDQEAQDEQEETNQNEDETSRDDETPNEDDTSEDNETGSDEDGQADSGEEEGQIEEQETHDDDETPLEAIPQYISTIEPFEKGELASRDLVAGDRMVAESDTHELYFNEETLAIKARSKVDDYTWSSAVPLDDLEHLSDVWKTFMTSPIVVDYKDLNRASTTTRDYPELMEVRERENGIVLRLYFPEVNFELDAEFYLEDDRVHVNVPDESHHYRDGADRQFEMSAIYIMPFWGAVQDLETEGYLFIPDGPGALIRYGEEKPFRSPFQERIYGRDEGISRIGITLRAIPEIPTQNIHMPVYGMSHGHKQQATFVNIENGAEFADIYSSPAGVRIDYFWTSAVFNYIETYFQSTGQAGKTFPYIYKTANPVNPHVSFHLLREEDADYAGMAKRYRDILEEQDRLPQGSALLEEDRDFPLMISAFMAEEEAALFFTRLKAVTNVDDLIEWAPELQELSGNGLIYSLHGAQGGGVSGHSLGNLGINRKVGGQGSFNELKDLARENDFGLLLNTDLAVGNESQIFQGDRVYNVDRDTSWRYTQNPIYDREFFVDSQGQTRITDRMLNSNQIGEDVGLDLSSVGFTLLSDYENGDLTDRRTVRESVQANIERLSESSPVFIDASHDYLWHLADAIYNVPTQHSQFVFETDVVPFMQIVLSGSVPMFSPYQNFSTQEARTILSLIDYNLYPSFLVTKESSSELMDSNTQNIYFSEFESLKPDIQETYLTLKEVLDPVRGVRIESREIPEVNVSVTTYENGMQIVTNYSTRVIEYNGVTVDPLSAELIQ